MRRRVVVTGLGVVTPIGASVSSSWLNLVEGRSGIIAIPDIIFNASDLPCQIAGVVDTYSDSGIDISSYISVPEQRRMDRFIKLALIAAEEAISSSGIHDFADLDANRVGVLVGSGIGGLQTIETNCSILSEKGPKRVSPFFIPASLINLASGYISIKHGFRGPNHSVVTACATGVHAIGDSARIIVDGDADVMVCGSSEAAICRIGITGFSASRALSTSFNDTPERASRPWDVNRDGFVMGEGSGILILEEYEHAKKRGAQIYAEVIGYGLSGDAYHITAPLESGDGAARAMSMAIKKSGIAVDKIDYINAHGTSTPVGDVIEIRAMKTVLGAVLPKIAVSSTKSSTGHLLGAAGSVESIFSILAINNNIAPPTLNLDSPDKECEGLNLVPHFAQSKTISVAMSNSFGFGGSNASIIFKEI